MLWARGVTRAKLSVVLYTCHQGACCSQEPRLSPNVILRTLEPSSPLPTALQALG